MNRQVVFSTFLILLIAFIVAESASAQTQTVSVGVSAGNVFTYDYVFYWSSTNPLDVVPPYLVAQNQTDYFQLTMETVTSTTVVMQTLLQFLNRTAFNNTEVAEVSSGITGCLYVYAANLTGGGLLFPSAEDIPLRINSTEYRSYLSGFRETNHISVNTTNLDDYVYSYMDLYFDRQTGIMVEYTLTEVKTATPNQKITQHMVLKESNAWVVPEFPSIIILPLFMVVTAIAVLILRRRQAVVSPSSTAI